MVRFVAARSGIEFGVPREVAFDFLIDPRNRIQWQSSLRRVEEAHPMPPQVGTAWREAAMGEFVSEMRLTAVDRPHRWAEEGTSRGFRLNLVLTFDESPGGCIVTSDVDLTGQGRTRLVARVLARAFPHAVRRDLEYAARILSQEAPPRR